jgi:hypothetical protein
VVEGTPFRTWVDIPLLDDQTTVVTDEFPSVRTLDEIVGPAFRTVADSLVLFLFCLRLALALPLAAGPCHRIFIVVRARYLNPWWKTTPFLWV